VLDARGVLKDGLRKPDGDLGQVVNALRAVEVVADLEVLFVGGRQLGDGLGLEDDRRRLLDHGMEEVVLNKLDGEVVIDAGFDGDGVVNGGLVVNWDLDGALLGRVLLPDVNVVLVDAPWVGDGLAPVNLNFCWVDSRRLRDDRQLSGVPSRVLSLAVCVDVRRQNGDDEKCRQNRRFGDGHV